MSYLFGFSDRIGRAHFWIIQLVIIVALIGGAVLMILTMNRDINGMPNGPSGVLVFTLVSIAVFVAALSAGVRRLHDRDKSGWWVLLYFVLPGILSEAGDAMRKTLDGPSGGSIIFYLVSFAISVWALVELGFLRGTDGTNRFGADPL